MTAITSDEDLRALTEALRGALGTAKGSDRPEPDPLGWRAGWPALTELGLLGFCVPEEHGGFGLQLDAAVVTAMELGAALHGAPFAGLTASAHALASEPSAEDLLAGVLAGQQVCAFGRTSSSKPVAPLVDGAEGADAVLLADPDGPQLLLHAGPSSWTADPSGLDFDVTRTCAAVTVHGTPTATLPGETLTRDVHGLLLAADAIGCIQHMLDRTVAYAAQRETFGRPIGGVQAVQHRLVDHTLRARGMALTALEAARLLATDATGGHRMAAVAMVGVSSSATHIIHDLLQLTGAIGFTWEYGLHLHTRRVHHDARLAANPRAAVRLLSDLEGWSDVR